MKNLMRQKRKGKILYKILAILFILVLLLAFFYQGMKIINNFFKTNELVFNKPVVVTFNKPLEIKKREILKPVTIIKVMQSKPEEIDTPIEHYICDVFGEFQCLTAVAIAQSESGLREDAYHYNTNSTLDTGIFQINQVHWNKKGCSFKELTDAYKNVDCAKTLFDQQGWDIWVAYKNNNYLSNL